METIIKEYLDANGRSPFGKWFNQLEPKAASKVTTSLYRLGQGHSSNVKHLGAGVYEYKLYYGPGYRVYFGKDGKEIVILLLGGTKKSQSRDIAKAKILWKEYKARSGSV